jgi:hypothetical protein
MAKRTDAARPMTEDELLAGITDALSLAGWRWFHVRRSDLAVVQGHQGWPDVFAVNVPRHLTLALELKAEDGRLTGDQALWLHDLNASGLNAITIRPGDYDRILNVILGIANEQLTADQAPARVAWPLASNE